MSAKRSAPYEIDQKKLQVKDTVKQQQNNLKLQLNNEKKKKLEQNERKIVTVKKDLKQQNQQSKQAQKNNQNKQKMGLFSSLNLSNNFTNGTGLFGNISQAPNLFSNTQNSIFSSANSLFSNNKTQHNELNKTSGLFSSSKNQRSIFNFQLSGVPPVKNTSSSLFCSKQNQNQGEDDGDSAELEAAQKIQVDPSKSTANYKYEQTCSVLLSLKAFKYKKNGGDLVQNVQIVVQQDLTSKNYYLIVRLPATKKQIFTGLIVEKKSQIQNVEVSVFSFSKQNKIENNILRFQFQKAQKGTQLKEQIEKIIKKISINNDQQEKQKPLTQLQKPENLQQSKQ